MLRRFIATAAIGGCMMATSAKAQAAVQNVPPAGTTGETALVDSKPADGLTDRLAEGADLLVAEMIDVPATIANVRRNTPRMAPGALVELTRHLMRHHLTADQLGELSTRAHVRQVVMHPVMLWAAPTEIRAVRDQLAAAFGDRTTIARDLDRF